MDEEETELRESLRRKELVNRWTGDEAPSKVIAVGAGLFPLTRSGSPQRKSHAPLFPGTGLGALTRLREAEIRPDRAGMPRLLLLSAEVRYY